MERSQRTLTLAVANERKEFHTEQPYLNVKQSTIWHLEPTPVQWNKLYLETVNRAISVGPIDYDATGFTDNDFERKRELKDSILNKSRIRELSALKKFWNLPI